MASIVGRGIGLLFYKRILQVPVLRKGDLKFLATSPVILQKGQNIPRESLKASIFPIPERATLPKDIQETMDEVEGKGGFLPNVFRTLAHRPDEFRSFFQYYSVLMEKETGTLSKAEKEMIVVATSAANNCLYCVVAHSALHRIYSKKPYVADQLSVNPHVADLSKRERAIVEFAEEIRNCQTVTEDQFRKLNEVGLTEEDIWDIGAITAFFAMSNRLAHLSGMRPNEEFYTIGRIKKEKGVNSS